jgi:hypothetical protein
MALQSAGVASAIARHLRQMRIKEIGDQGSERSGAGVWSQEMDEDVVYDFIQQLQEMVLVTVGIQPLLDYCSLSSPSGFLSSQLGNGAFEIDYPGLYPCEKGLIHWY